MSRHEGLDATPGRGDGAALGEGRRITHQACRCPYGRGVTVYYTRWGDGRVTASETAWRDVAGFVMATMGHEMPMLMAAVPRGLKWIRTVDLVEEDPPGYRP